MRRMPTFSSREPPRRCELGALRTRLAELERTHHRPVGAAARTETIATGFPELDERLGGGWRVGALNELLIPEGDSGAGGGAGGGALEALLPALARRRTRWLAWIDAPWLQRLYPPALVQIGFDLTRLLLVRPGDAREQAWALDLALRSGACDAVIARLNGSEIWRDDLSLRRLQLAAEEGDALGFLVRSAGFARTASPAAVRVEAAPLPSSDPRRRRLRVTVLRCRAGHDRRALSEAPLELEWSRDPLVEPAPATRRSLAVGT